MSKALPIVTLVGRANVGKSTLFNRLTKTHNSLVLDYPGLTRDRIYGIVNHDLITTNGKIQPLAFILIDTPGLFPEVNLTEASQLSQLAQQQTRVAIAEADLILILLDIRTGLLKQDLLLINHIRSSNKPFLVLINKTDGVDLHSSLIDFYSLGQGFHTISAIQGLGLSDVFFKISEYLPKAINQPDFLITSVVEDDDEGSKKIDGDEKDEKKDAAKTAIAVIGRPNVGKSSLINRLLGKDRVLTCDHPGTTRDSIRLEWNKAFDLIDTAGVRRRKQVKETVEKLSVGKTLQAIREADIVLLLIDAKEGIVDQDLHLLSFAVESGRGLIITVNKWDLLDARERQYVKYALERRLSFADYAKWLYISASTGKGCREIMPALKQTAKSVKSHWTPSHLTQLLEKFVCEHQLPAVNNRRIKLRYAHQGGNNPLIIVIHGNQVESVPDSYKRYLINRFQDALKLSGAPIQLVLKAGKNPYAGKVNKLTPRQIAKKRRLMRFVKRKK